MPKDLRPLAASLFMSAAETYRETCWRPAVDIYRGHVGWLVKFDLAGVRPEDVQVRVQGRHLIVEGVRRDLSVMEGQRAYSMEISYNRFARSVELPFELDQVEIQSEYRDGMLLVTIAMG